MAEDSDTFKLTSKLESTTFTGEENGIKRRLSFSSETEIGTVEEAEITNEVQTFQNVPDGSASRQLGAENNRLKAENLQTEQNVKLQAVNGNEDKENTDFDHTNISNTENSEEKASSGPGSFQQSGCEDGDAAVVRTAREDGRVSVVFPGAVTQDACCRFVSEILKCILYQRQQLPMTYEQLVYYHKNQQDVDVRRRPAAGAGVDVRRCRVALQQLEEVLQQLEELFSLSAVPRVLLLLGGSLVLPAELYEINMEAVAVAGGERSLRASSCLRQLFRALFVADLLSDSRPPRLMATTVLALAHRDCGVSRFRPKLHFKVPTRVKKRVIALASEGGGGGGAAAAADWTDYVWFQAPMAIKGFDPKS